jgi:aromatic-amino-acid transaminase
MLNKLATQPEDKILGLSKLFRADPRDTKIDLGVGVYKDANGNTPIMAAVKQAEQRLWSEETTKAYTALIGDGAYHTAMADLILGDAVPRDRVSFAHTPGGTGAIRQILELVKMATPDATVWMSNPTWPNHPSIINHLGLKSAVYNYFDTETRAVDFDAMMVDLEKVASGDIVLLHGCCHNPTGANLNMAQWEMVAEVLLRRNAIPFVDIAYQGFGDGLNEDAVATRLLASKFPEMLIAASCSKNFGIYRERTGLAMVLSTGAQSSVVTQGNLGYLNRQNYSFPPDHGARLVTMVMMDDELRQMWEDELEQVRNGMLAVRQQLADVMRAATGSDRFGFIAEHRGMFSRLGATPQQVQALRDDFGIYMAGDSRMNIAGMTTQNVPILADAFMAVGV